MRTRIIPLWPKVSVSRFTVSKLSIYIINYNLIFSRLEYWTIISRHSYKISKFLSCSMKMLNTTYTLLFSSKYYKINSYFFFFEKARRKSKQKEETFNVSYNLTVVVWMDVAGEPALLRSLKNARGAIVVHFKFWLNVCITILILFYFRDFSKNYHWQ